MGQMSILEKAEERDQKVQAQRALAECFDINNHGPVRKYSPHDDETGQFIEHFYPWERIYLKTNNFEKFGGRTKKSSKCFRNDRELLEYTFELSNPSSNNEDRPPPSEDLFFDSGMEHLYDTVLKTTAYTPRLTLLQCSLLRDLSSYMLEDNRSAEDSKRIVERRLELIRGYCKELKRKRYAKAYRRFRRVRSKKMGVANEAVELLVEELIDKNLGREFYYASDEPSPCHDILLEARREAIKRKYLQYVTDVRYRRMYRNKIYFSVNKDVPPSDTMHMSSEDERLPASDGTMSSCCLVAPLIRMRAGEDAPTNVGADDWKPTRKTVINTTYKSPRGGIVNVIYAHDQSAANVSSSSPTSPAKYMTDALRESPIQKESTQNSYYGSPDGGIVSITLSSNVNTASKSDARSPILRADDLAEDSMWDETLTNNAYITAEDFANDSMQDQRAPNAADESIFDNELSRQIDSDIPTSEAELMSDFGTSISPRMRSKRKRLLKSLHRLLRAEHLQLPSPAETGRYLCDIELEAKGLSGQNASDKRVQAIRRKFERFAEDATFRERYLQRVRSIKEQQRQGSDGDIRTPARNIGQAAMDDSGQKPKAIIVHHVRRSPRASPAKPGSFPGSPEYFSSQRDLATEMDKPGDSDVDQSLDDMDATLIQLPLYGKQTPDWIRNMPEEQRPTRHTNATFSVPHEQSNYVKLNRTFDIVSNGDQAIPEKQPARRRQARGTEVEAAPAHSRKTWGPVVNPFENLDWQPMDQGPPYGPDDASTPVAPEPQVRRQAWGNDVGAVPSRSRKAWGPVVNPFEDLDWQPIEEGRPSSPDIPRGNGDYEGFHEEIEIVDEAMPPSSPYELHASPSSIVQRQMVESTIFQSPGGGLVEIAVQSNLLDENSFRSKNVSQRSTSPDRMPSWNQTMPDLLDESDIYAEDQLEESQMPQYVIPDATNDYEDTEDQIDQALIPEYESYEDSLIDQSAMPEYESFDTSAEYIEGSLIDQTAMPEYTAFDTSAEYFGDPEDSIIDHTTMPEYESYNASEGNYDDSLVDQTAMPEYTFINSSEEYIEDSSIDQTTMPEYESFDATADDIDQTKMPAYKSIDSSADYFGDVEDQIDDAIMPEFLYASTKHELETDIVDESDKDISQTLPPDFTEIDEVESDFDDDDEDINATEPPDFQELPEESAETKRVAYEEVYEVIEEEFIEIIEEQTNTEAPTNSTGEPDISDRAGHGQLALPWYDTEQPMESRPDTTTNTTFDMSEAMTSHTVDMADLEQTESTFRMSPESAPDELVYADITTAESTFDDEVPSSEQELIPNYDDEHFLRCDDPRFNRPMSRSKLKLFIELAKSDPALNAALQPRPSMKPSQAIESDRGHFEQLQLLREMQRHNILEDLTKKRLNLIRHFHAQRTKRLRKLATIRLLAIVDSSKRNTTDANTLEGGMRFSEIRDKGLADRDSYYNDDEPEHFSVVLNKRLMAIGNKYRIYYNASEERRRAILRRILGGLLEKITLPKNYP